ncbi:MAG TPA: acetylornithine deacetylase [Thermoanaerobaculia bacterium]
MTRLSDTDLLARLVGFDTTSCNSNLPLADFLADYLEVAGVRVERQPSPEGTKANLVAWIGPEPNGDRRGLVLSGHMDVVPAEELEWRSDPFTLTDLGDRLVARGACDMKGFLALAANLALAVSQGSAGSLAAPLVLVFTYDEEVGTLGARHLTESFAAGSALPRNAVIGEPTSLQVARCHKGHFKMRVTLHGQSAHSGYPHLGANSIEPAGELIVALSALRRELEAEVVPHRELFPEVPFVPLNVGTVHGGSAINVVPERCAVEIGVRPLPGEGDPSAALIARVRQVVDRTLAPFAPAIRAEVELLSDSPPLLLAETADVHRELCALVGQQASSSVSFATDAGWLQRLGIDCAIWGPGSITVAHKPNEFVSKADLIAARAPLERLIDRFCREAA